MTGPVMCQECGVECTHDTDHGTTTHMCLEHGWQETTFDEHGPKI